MQPMMHDFASQESRQGHLKSPVEKKGLSGVLVGFALEMFECRHDPLQHDGSPGDSRYRQCRLDGPLPYTVEVC